MGFKADCLLVSERAPGFLATLPAHHSDRVEPVLARLGLRAGHRLGGAQLSDCLFPPAGRTAVGCYDGALFLADQKRINGAVEFPHRCALLQAVLREYPKATVLVVSLHSVSNYYAYSLYEAGRRTRAHAGAGDGAETEWEEGEPLAEERPHYARSFQRDGRRFFLSEVAGRTEEFDAASYGETLAFAAMGRFFGTPFDCFPDRVDVELFDLRPARPWWRFW